MNHPEQVAIFQKLKRLIEIYSDRLKPQHDSPSSYDLWSLKGLTAGKNAKLYEKFFAGATIRKNSVAFYLMPIYKSNLRDSLSPDLLNLLKGKYLFQIRKWNTNLEEQITNALKIAFKYIQERGWV